LIRTLIPKPTHLDQSRRIKVDKGDQAKKIFLPNQGDGALLMTHWRSLAMQISEERQRRNRHTPARLQFQS
jgi:hypothetical protein